MDSKMVELTLIISFYEKCISSYSKHMLKRVLIKRTFIKRTRSQVLFCKIFRNFSIHVSYVINHCPSVASPALWTITCLKKGVKGCKICSKLNIKTPKRRHWSHCYFWTYLTSISSGAVVDFEEVKVCWVFNTLRYVMTNF